MGRDLIDKLEREQMLSEAEFIELLSKIDAEMSAYLFEKAGNIKRATYGEDVYIRGLIEFTNYCKNNCYYCGIRCGNEKAQRYRLTKEEILICCEEGYASGFRTFVLQGGEDAYFNDDRLADIVSAIKTAYPDCAVTLSAGEKSRESYQRLFDAGADRYLLRHETADPEHYAKLHPPNLSLEHRKECLRNLKEIGYQVGAGFMVGSPYQTPESIVQDLLFLKELQPQMVGIGPFLAHKDTPFRGRANGSLELTLFLLGIIRLMLPKVLLPATTALGTLHERGRELGIQAGANVVMPNLSPKAVRGKYLLYDNKKCTGEEAAEGLAQLRKSMEEIGSRIVVSRGDWKN